MKSGKLGFLLLFIVSAKCFSQAEEARRVTDVIKVTVLNPGVGYEKAVGKLQTIQVQAFLSTSFAIGYSGTLGNTSSISFEPALGFQYRYYYNNAKRQQKGRRTEMNSMNYISPTFKTYLSQNRIFNDYSMARNRHLINTVGIVWGFQRNYEKRFSLDMNVGLGCLFSRGIKPGPANEPVTGLVGQLSLLSQVNFGFWLNKRE